MKLKVAICDDEPTLLATLTTLVQTWANGQGHLCDVAPFPTAEAFLFNYSSNNAYNILLLDVEMPGMNGIDLAKSLRKKGNRSEIIFITSHYEFCGEGYEVDALHYLIKPLNAEKLSSLLTKAAQRIADEPPSLIINCEGETVKLFQQDILYAEALLHYTAIYTKDNVYKLKENISAFAEKLSEDFFHAHRSYYVSLKHIKRISRTELTLDNGAKLPLSRGKYDDINRAYIRRN